MTKKDQKAAEVLANRKTAFVKRVATLTGHVMGRTPHAAAMAAFDAGRTADDFAAEIAAREPVGRALHPQKTVAIESAAADAAATIGRVQLELEKAGWDIKVAAPEPSYREYHHHDYKSRKARRSLFESLTELGEGQPSYRNPGEPKIVQMSEKGIARFIEAAEQEAALQYDAFICKMVAKIGDGAVDAVIDGSHVWDHSILTVTKADGSVERWKTQQIWNYSVHGKRFPQWPSRVVK